MRQIQFGGIENIAVRGGVPIVNSDTKVVRVARLGGESDPGEAAA